MRGGKIINLMGQKFGRLTVIKQLPSGNNKTNRPRWKCLCDCGNETIVKDGRWITSGNTKSCGCLRSEVVSKRASIRNVENKKYDVRTAAAARVYRERYNKGELTFEQFLKLSQMNCYYCNLIPNNKASNEQKNHIQFYINDNIFMYSGLDRKNNELNYSINNCLPCCKYCNYAKRERSYNEFIVWSKKLYNKFCLNIINSSYQKENNINISIAKEIFKIHYNDGNLSFAQFLEKSQNNCYYCDDPPANIGRKRNNKEIIFKYNGLDRVDNSLGHDYNNCQPCCKYCNFAKRERTVEEFKIWAERLYFNIIKKETSLMTSPF